jgi:uracil-DNA glycosylase
MAEPNVNPGSKRRGKQIVVSPLQHGWLKAMGVDVPWIGANEPVVEAATAPVVGAAALTRPALTQPAPRPSLLDASVQPAGAGQDNSAAIDLSDFSLSALSDTILACQRCGLCETRQHAVPGDGVVKPTILIVGEAPGEQEDLQGKPFVGRSGQLLDNMLHAIGHARDTTVFITNVVKCRPPANRNPRDEEILACEPYLARQIEMLAPKAILAMGRFAAHALLKSEAPLQKLREHTHTLELGGQSLPVVVTYHPAYLLRRPVDKRLAWEDLKRLRGLVTG